MQTIPMNMIAMLIFMINSWQGYDLMIGKVSEDHPRYQGKNDLTMSKANPPSGGRGNEQPNVQDEEMVITIWHSAIHISDMNMQRRPLMHQRGVAKAKKP